MIWPLWRTVWRLLEKSRNKITIWCMLSCFSHVQLFSILWTVARQVPLSMGIFQEGLLEWVTMPSSRGSSWLRDGTHVSCLQRWQFGSLPLVPPGKPKTIIWSISPLLGIYPKKITILKDTCTPVFIAALFTIARTWKEPKCPLTEKCIKKIRYIYTMD